MSVLYEFDCPNCGRVEKRCPVATLETVCPNCAIFIPRAYSFSINVQVVPNYHEALEETHELARRGKI